MFFQRVMKGIAELSRDDASRILTEDGILSVWVSRGGPPHGKPIQDRLTWRNLDWHLNHYADHDPLEGGERFFEHTPFISTTAGTVERDATARQNYILSAFRTALGFATREFETDGWIFFGYVYVLGKRSIPLEGFAEEVRDLHVYTGFLPYLHEGEIAAKLRIPAVNLERCERYDGPRALGDLANGVRPSPVEVLRNKGFAPPEQYANVRDLLD